MKLLVITEKPDPLAEGLEGRGNLAAPLGELYVDLGPERPITRVEDHGQMAMIVMSLRREVFQKGELLLVGDDGREVGGRGRKPSKWGVGYRTFPMDKAQEAVALVEELSGV